MIVGYGICGPGEADRYMEDTLKEFQRLCDKTIIVFNNVTDKERELVKKYGFITREDNREWGKYQHKIKESLMGDVGRYKPDYCVCLDMDEVFDPELTREKLLKTFETGDALYFYIVNLWNDGWNRKWSFWNVRAWKWNGDTKFENRPLHCGLAPAWCYRFGSYAPFYVEHSGLKTKESRQKKIERYETYDPKAKYKDKSYYEALKSNASDKLDYTFIRQQLNKEVGHQKKRKQTIQEKEYFYVQSPKGKVVDIPAKHLQEHLDRGFTLIKKVGETPEVKKDKKIAYIGSFKKLWDEEYIALAFEQIGFSVTRIEETKTYQEITFEIVKSNPDFVIFAKLHHKQAEDIVKFLNERQITSVCWLFDLYFGYTRENQVANKPCFKADYVITTDGGHNERWKEYGINHTCIRQGIHDPECYKLKGEKEYDVVFIGSNNPLNKRNSFLKKLSNDFDFHWFGKKDDDEVRSEDLNNLFAKTKIVVGDSVYSPHYWSNRVVETLGRGGFLIHKEVEGIKDGYPDLVTYDGTYKDLKNKIEYYLKHDKEREEIIEKNFQKVKEEYKCSDMCKLIEKKIYD